jgi:hypothetical protein
MEGTLGFVERGTLRGGSREAALSGGLAKARRPAAGFARASPLGGHVRGCASIRQDWLLRPFEPRACDRRCPGHQDRGNQARCEQSLPGRARGGESRHGPLIRGSSAGQASQEAPRKSKFSQEAGHPESGSRGQPRRRRTGLGRSRSCSWIVEIAGVGFRCPSTSCESGRRGLDTEARRSGPSTTSSFDEAAVKAGLVLFPGRARQRASAAGTRPSPWPNTPRGGSAARRALDRGLTGPSGAGSKRKQGTSRARPKLGARRQAGLYPRSRRSSGFGLVGGCGSLPPRRKSKGKVIRESDDPEGARIVTSVAEVG